MDATPAQRFLAIETSSPALSLAAGDEREMLAQFRGPLEWRRAEHLFDGLRKLLRRLSWKPAELTGIAVSIGPGSFTGIRIGLAAARALGQALEIPVVGVNALETIAAGMAAGGREASEKKHLSGAFSREPASLICPLIDALRGGVFTALYERAASGRLRRLEAERLIPWDQWRPTLMRAARARPVWVSGDALKLYGAELKRGRIHSAAEESWYPQAAALLELARGRLAKAKKDAYKRVFPLYLRQAAAQERKEKLIS